MSVRSDTASREPLILLFQLLQPLHLIRHQPAIHLAPPIVGERRHAGRAHRLGKRPALQYQSVDLPQLGDYLFEGELLLGHSFILHLA